HRKKGYVEVIVTYNHPRFFSSLFGNGAIPVSARAVAQGTFLPPAPAVMALDLTAKPGFKTNGGGTFNISGTGAVLVNSSSPPALQNVGGGTINAPGGIDVNGAVSGGGTYNPAPSTGTAQAPDPYSYLPVPSQPAATGTISKRTGTSSTWDIYPGNFASDP